MGDFFNEMGDGLASIGDSLMDSFTTALSNLIGMVMYYITIFFCELLSVVYKLFSVFSGINKVDYDGDSQYLINLFFANKSINNVYWGMALIGFALIFAFAIAAMVRKMFDVNDKIQRSIGSILLGAFKSLLVILVCSMCMTAAINAVNIIIQQVEYVISNAETLDKKDKIVYTDEQFAAMGRVFNTIGNYSLNPSYDSRYNMNCCYNDIRGDLYYLKQQGVFDYYYITYDEDGKEKLTWQSALQKIYQAADVRYDLVLDVPNNNVSKALKAVMNEMKKNPSFAPLAEFKKTRTTTETVPIDSVVFLLGTLDSANNGVFNIKPSIYDEVRGPFMTDDNSIYSLTDVRTAFDIGLGGISYLMILILCYFIIKNLINAIFSCIARIINLIGLYITAPAFAAVIPLDDGDKFKQWLNACIVQMVGIFGNIIPIRLVIMFLPMILDSKLTLIPGSGTAYAVINMIAKGILIVGLFEGSGRFSELFNGILSGNGGFASAHASDMRHVGERFSRGLEAVTGVGYVKQKVSEVEQTMTMHGGAVTGGYHYLRYGNKEAPSRNEKSGGSSGGGGKSLPASNNNVGSPKSSTPKKSSTLPPPELLNKG